MGLITLNHDEHRRHRRLLSHGFSMTSLYRFLPAFDRHARHLVKAWEAYPVVESVHDWMTRVTFDIIADQAFGYDANCIDGSPAGNAFAHDCCKIAQMVMLHFLHAPGLAHLWRLLHYRTFANVDRIIYSCIAQRKAERAARKEKELDSSAAPQNNSGSADASTRSSTPASSRRGSYAPRDLLDLMLDNGTWTDLELRDEAFIFFLAGHETTAVTMPWFLAHVSADLKLQQRLREEANDVLGTEPLSKETEKRLPVLTNVIKEILRLYPPAFAVTRFAEKAVDVDGARIPEGYDVFISVLGLQRQAAAYENPNTFNPDRWEASDLPDPLFFLPFTFGPRQCIGMNLAWLEMKATLSTILRTYELRLLGEIPDWTTKPITTSPKTPIRIELKRLATLD